MEGDELRTEEVLSGRNALGDSEANLTGGIVHPVDAPLARGVEAVLEDLEPFQTLDVGLESIGDLGHVDDSGSEMGDVDWVRLVAGDATIEGVVPFGDGRGTSRDGDDLCRRKGLAPGVCAGVADDVWGTDVGDGSGVVRLELSIYQAWTGSCLPVIFDSSNALHVTLRNAIDPELLEDRVGRSTSCEARDGKE